MCELLRYVIPYPASEKRVPETACACGNLLFLEYEEGTELAAVSIRKFWKSIGQKPLLEQKGRQKKGPTRRIRLLVDPEIGAEAYHLEIRSESVTVRGGTPAGVFYGTQSLLQICAAVSLTGGHDLLLPTGIIDDKPRFEWRGIMLDSSRHFQEPKVIFRLLDMMARFKYNRFHWHLTDRQGWRLPLACAPELTRPLPKKRGFSFGVYTREEIRAVCRYAEERFIRIVPEIEMPGHSACVFRSRPDLACGGIEDPFEEDVWEFCIGNPETEKFLEKILDEVCEIFPDSACIHIGGDEASDHLWKKCPSCNSYLKKNNCADFREAEHHFLARMNAKLHDLGRQGIVWDSSYTGAWDRSCGLILQNYLKKEGDFLLRHGTKVINSLVESCYFDYPLEVEEDDLVWRRKSRDFDPAAGKADDEFLGGEGCIWTEKIPQWRLCGRSFPRLRALSEALWSPKKKPAFADYLRRERLFLQHHFFEEK